MTLYCDESDDGHSYALAGWLAVPSAWDRFDDAWKSMLSSLPMPDGSPCPAFHAAEIVNRDTINNSRFKGWSFDQEKNAFIKATDLIVSKSACSIMWPLGVAVEVPSTFTDIQRDAIWLLLFLKLFGALIETFPAQRGIAFVFDEKPSIAHLAMDAYRVVRERFDQEAPEYLTTIGFRSDEDAPGLQAADLLAYEWRKRITDANLTPSKAVRRSYQRIREARPDGALWRYGRDVFDKALESEDQSRAWIDYFVDQPPTHRD